MGAPTSPVLSNLVTSDFDIKMHQWAQHNGITFTRFVDDLTFSHSKEVLDMAYLDTIEGICTSYNLKLNRTKTVFMDVDSPKTITGLVLGTTVDIQPIFYNNLNDDLKRLKSLSEVCAITGVIQDRALLKKFKQEVYGQVNFIGTVEGYRSAIFYDYRQKYKKALEVSEQLFAKRWLHFSYH